MKDRLLLVVAHPDDELLGAGATMSKAVEDGREVFVCILSRVSVTRKDDLIAAMQAGYNLIGVSDYTVGNFKCIGFGNEDHRAMVQFVENAIMEYKPSEVITHHPSDVNYDHYMTSIVCQEAVRLPQRQIGYNKKIRRFSYMEVQTSTDYALNQAWGLFTPNYYVPVTKKHLKKKLDALALYDNVLRPAPFPRCKRNILAKAAVRGSESGFYSAEAFQTVFNLGD